MSDESTQQKLTRVRPPRVQITYDVETGGAIETKELPLVVGILADLAGNGELPAFKDRKFVEIDRDNFDAVLASLKPGVELKSVANKLKKDAVSGTDDLTIAIPFTKFEDFRPEAIIRNVPDLNALLLERQLLNDLLSDLDVASDPKAVLASAQEA